MILVWKTFIQGLKSLITSFMKSSFVNFPPVRSCKDYPIFKCDDLFISEAHLHKIYFLQHATVKVKKFIIELKSFLFNVWLWLPKDDVAFLENDKMMHNKLKSSLKIINTWILVLSKWIKNTKRNKNWETCNANATFEKETG